eukprot:4408807-Amphidinium_carterae.1
MGRIREIWRKEGKLANKLILSANFPTFFSHFNFGVFSQGGVFTVPKLDCMFLFGTVRSDSSYAYDKGLGNKTHSILSVTIHTRATSDADAVSYTHLRAHETEADL